MEKGETARSLYEAMHAFASSHRSDLLLRGARHDDVFRFRHGLPLTVLPTRPITLQLDAFGALLAVLALVAADMAALGPGRRNESGLRLVTVAFQVALPVDKAEWKRSEASRLSGAGAPSGEAASLPLDHPPPTAATSVVSSSCPQAAERRRCRPGMGLASSRTPTGPPYPA